MRNPHVIWDAFSPAQRSQVRSAKQAIHKGGRVFIDNECDGILIRDVCGPQVYCRSCGHYTWAVDGNRRCAWCKSLAIGGQPCLLKHVRAMGPIQDAERPRTKHQRLVEGFALLKGAEL